MHERKQKIKPVPQTTPVAQKNGRSALVILTIVLVVTFGISIGISGYFLGYRQGEVIVSKIYEEKIAKVEPAIPFIIPDDKEVMSITGNVKEITDDVIVFTAAIPAKSLFELNQEADYTAKITDDTNIVTEKTVIRTKESKPDSSTVETTEISLDDIPEKTQITVTSDSDIYGITNFDAKKIAIVEKTETIEIE